MTTSLPAPPRLADPTANAVTDPHASLGSSAARNSPPSFLSLPAPSEATPARRSRRDPFIDGVRAIGILLVIALHWLMVEATWDGNKLVVGNALSHGSAWLLTWLQPLPLLFFAAGAAVGYDLGHHPDKHGWWFAGTRLLRMAMPVGIFAAIWAALIVVLPPLGVPESAVDRAARIVPQPLWFLGVQVALLPLTPLMLRALRRWGARVLVLVALAPLLVDLLRFSDGVVMSGFPNILLVWAVPYLGGLLYAERRAVSAARRRSDGVPDRAVLALLAGGGLASTALLIAIGPYPSSLIGMPGDIMSNLAPPTAPVVAFAISQVAAALLVRDALSAWAERSGLVQWVGARSMGLYLWHLTAMFALTGVVLLAAGRVLPDPWTWDWWTTRAGYMGAAALVAVASRVERAADLPGRARRLVARARTRHPPLASAGPGESPMTANGAPAAVGRAMG